MEITRESVERDYRCRLAQKAESTLMGLQARKDRQIAAIDAAFRANGLADLAGDAVWNAYRALTDAIQAQFDADPYVNTLVETVDAEADRQLARIAANAGRIF